MATQLAKNSPYSASFTGAAMLFSEMNVAVKMLLENDSPETIKLLKTDANYIQIKAAKSRERVTAEFVRRFRSVPKSFWERYITLGESEQRLALLYVILKTYQILFEFQINLVIHLSTANDDEHRPDVIDIFDAITDDLAPRGIDFTYDFDADHDRYIRLDNGWKINLGRGLDIFERVERFSIDRISQEDRRCKACSIAFVREEDQE